MARNDNVVEAALGYGFSFLITTILLAFLIGVPLGAGARRMYNTMFNPDVVVSPTNQTQ
jgi:ABC-type dipeptide/oligopeptide/nickel transport system permease component